MKYFLTAFLCLFYTAAFAETPSAASPEPTAAEARTTAETPSVYQTVKLDLSNSPESIKSVETLLTGLSDDEFLKFVAALQVLSEQDADGLLQLLNGKTVEEVVKQASKDEEKFNEKYKQYKENYPVKQLHLLRTGMIQMLKPKATAVTQKLPDSKIGKLKFNTADDKQMKESMRLMLKDMNNFELAQFAYSMYLLEEDIKQLSGTAEAEKVMENYFSGKTFAEFIAAFRATHGNENFDDAVNTMYRGLTEEDYKSLRQEFIDSL